MARFWKYLVIILLLVVALGAAWYSGFRSSLIHQETEESAQVLLNRIEKVMKVVVVEGHISELYNYKDYYNFDWSPFRKKAILRVNAKASIGYDFDKVQIEISEQDKTIYIKDFPMPEILSIDHDLDYYDISQGTFNSFSEDDYDHINKNAKEYVRKMAQSGDLMQSAIEQKQEVLDMIRMMLEGLGWHLKVEGQDDILDG